MDQGTVTHDIETHDLLYAFGQDRRGLPGNIPDTQNEHGEWGDCELLEATLDAAVTQKGWERVFDKPSRQSRPTT